jgi:hypothetical protein
MMVAFECVRRGRGQRHNGYKVPIFAVARYNHDWSNLDHLRHDIASKVAHDDSARSWLKS